MPEATDDELMRRLGEGSEAAFDQLYSRHKGAVFGYCLRMFGGNRAQSEEITQEVWMRVLKAASGYEPRGTFRAWLMTLSRNEALRSLQRKSSQLSASEGDLEEVAADFRMEASFLSASEAGEARRAIDELPDGQRAVFLLWAEEEATYEEIGAKLNLEFNSVRALLYRARQSLRKKLEKA